MYGVLCIFCYSFDFITLTYVFQNTYTHTHAHYAVCLLVEDLKCLMDCHLHICIDSTSNPLILPQPSPPPSNTTNQPLPPASFHVSKV